MQNINVKPSTLCSTGIFSQRIHFYMILYGPRRYCIISMDALCAAAMLAHHYDAEMKMFESCSTFPPLPAPSLVRSLYRMLNVRQ